jgi:hypothetical protein
MPSTCSERPALFDLLEQDLWMEIRVTKAYKQHEARMPRTFSMDTSASPSLLLARARRAASLNGVRLVGDERSGRFSHKMPRGEYRRILLPSPLRTEPALASVLLARLPER